MTLPLSPLPPIVPDSLPPDAVDLLRAEIGNINGELAPSVNLLTGMLEQFLSDQEEELASFYKPLVKDLSSEVKTNKKSLNRLIAPLQNELAAEIASIGANLGGLVEVSPPEPPQPGALIFNLFGKRKKGKISDCQCVPSQTIGAPPPDNDRRWVFLGKFNSAGECIQKARELCGGDEPPPAPAPAPAPAPSPAPSPVPEPGICPFPGPVPPQCPIPPPVPIQILPGPVPWPLPPNPPKVDPPLIIILPITGPGQPPMPPFPWPIGIPFPWPGTSPPITPRPPSPPTPGEGPPGGEPPGEGDKKEDKCKVEINLGLNPPVDWTQVPKDLRDKLIECGWKLPDICEGFPVGDGPGTLSPGETLPCNPDPQADPIGPLPLWTSITQREIGVI